MMDMEWLRRLIRLVEESEIDTLEVARRGTSVKIAKSPPGGVVGVGPATQLATPAQQQPAGEPAQAGAGAPDVSSDLHEIVSPMVGTFYRAPAPDAPPYVEVGDRVTKGQTVCILEAMKLMNELEAEVSGVVRDIAVLNADAVEFGQALFRIELDGAG